MSSQNVNLGNSMIERSWIGDCFVSKISKTDLLDLVDEWIGKRDKNHYITAINVSKLVMMQHDNKLADYISNSSINIADGFPIYLAAILLGNPIPARITGVELMEDLLRLSDNKCYRLFFLGSKPQVLEKVITRCRKEFPNLVIAGSRDGYFKKEDEKDIVQHIAKTESDILLVALGIPQKEYFVGEHLKKLNTVVSLPVGGAFDVFAGTKKRAPAWAQRLGMEWLWRSFYDRSRARLIYRSMISFLVIFAKEMYEQRVLGNRRL